MNSLFLKIFLWFWLTVIVIGLVLVFATAVAHQRSGGDDKLRAFLSVYLPGEAKYAVEVYEHEGQAGLARHLLILRSERNKLLTPYFFDADGQELSGNELPPKAAEFVRTVQGDEPVFSEKLEPILSKKSFTEDRYRFAAQRIKGTDGRQYIMLLVFARVPILTILQGLGYGALVNLIVVLLVGGVFCFWLARHITDPLLQVAGVASQIADGQLHARVNKKIRWRRDEIGGLGLSFDRMAERIESLMDAQRRLLGTISHELRSPLTRLSVASGLLRECSSEERMEYLERIELETDHLDKLIGQLLTLARIDSGAESSHKERVDLANLVQEIAADGNFEGQARGCAVRVDSVDSCIVTGIAEHLRRAIENVVRNAIHYTEVCMRRRGTSAAPVAAIQIRDHGPGVPMAHLEKIFLPFHRVPREGQSTNGAGLGLAITERIIRMHGGKVRATNAVNGGLVVELELPIAEA